MLLYQCGEKRERAESEGGVQKLKNLKRRRTAKEVAICNETAECYSPPCRNHSNVQPPPKTLPQSLQYDQIPTVHRPALWPSEANCWGHIDHSFRGLENELCLDSSSWRFREALQGQWTGGGACNNARAWERRGCPRGIGSMARRSAGGRRNHRPECEAVD
jgi:hypothetical protein